MPTHAPTFPHCPCSACMCLHADQGRVEGVAKFDPLEDHLFVMSVVYYKKLQSKHTSIMPLNNYYLTAILASLHVVKWTLVVTARKELHLTLTCV